MCLSNIDLSKLKSIIDCIINSIINLMISKFFYHLLVNKSVLSGIV